jgi:hypothetical protein
MQTACNAMLNIKFSKLTALVFFCSPFFANAFWGSSKVTVACMDGAKIAMKFIYQVDRNEITETSIISSNISKSGKDEILSIKKLEECKINNSKEWICGGKVTKSDRTLDLLVGDEYSFYRGNFKYLPMRIISNGVTKNVGYCEDRFLIK